MKSVKQLKREATLREYKRVFDNMCLPARDIFVETSEGRYMRSAWTNLNSFGWSKWELVR